ncbi:hypothetical protein L3Q82_019235 [Scortum barcoo]|uniref:Uncharacterized protein n=1 Tax=Scortum barcoo TaxID=214431 RepID=A0ACB8VAV6_9TELE|nr:hypothetical protein L3Q82_019235 [Scortum barcoo]
MSWTLDTRVKRGAELSTDHHLVVSWLRWQRRKLDRPGRPKRILFRGRLGTLSPSGPCSLPPLSTQQFEVVDAQGLWCLSWWQSRTRWWTPEVDRYRQAKQAAARAVLEAKTRVWEEFGEAMEEDYRSASKRFWQTVRRLRRGKQYSANTVYSAGGELLTSTEDIVGRWKKYFLRISSIPPTCLPVRKQEAGDSEVDSSITRKPKSLR